MLRNALRLSQPTTASRRTVFGQRQHQQARLINPHVTALEDSVAVQSSNVPTDLTKPLKPDKLVVACYFSSMDSAIEEICKVDARIINICRAEGLDDAVIFVFTVGMQHATTGTFGRISTDEIVLMEHLVAAKRRGVQLAKGYENRQIILARLKASIAAIKLLGDRKEKLSFEKDKLHLQDPNKVVPLLNTDWRSALSKYLSLYKDMFIGPEDYLCSKGQAIIWKSINTGQFHVWDLAKFRTWSIAARGTFSKRKKVTRKLMHDSTSDTPRWAEEEDEDYEFKTWEKVIEMARAMWLSACILVEGKELMHERVKDNSAGGTAIYCDKVSCNYFLKWLEKTFKDNRLEGRAAFGLEKDCREHLANLINDPSKPDVEFPSDCMSDPEFWFAEVVTRRATRRFQLHMNSIDAQKKRNKNTDKRSDYRPDRNNNTQARGNKNNSNRGRNNNSTIFETGNANNRRRGGSPRRSRSPRNQRQPHRNDDGSGKNSFNNDNFKKDLRQYKEYNKSCCTFWQFKKCKFGENCRDEHFCGYLKCRSKDHSFLQHMKMKDDPKFKKMANGGIKFFNSKFYFNAKF